MQLSVRKRYYLDVGFVNVMQLNGSRYCQKCPVFLDLMRSIQKCDCTRESVTSLFTGLSRMHLCDHWHILCY